LGGLDANAATKSDTTRVGPQKDGSYYVATRQRLTPAGKQAYLGGRTYEVALSPDQKLLAVKGSRGVTILDATTGEVRQTLAIKVDPEIGGFFASRVSENLRVQSYTGIAWSAMGDRLYNTDPHARLLIAARDAGGKFAWTEPVMLPGPGRTTSAFVTPKNSGPGGFALDASGGKAYVALSRNNTVAIVDLASKKVIGQIPVGMVPFTVVVNGSRAYVSNWGGRAPRPGDTTADSSATPIVVGKDTGTASTGSLSIIDLATAKVVKEVPLGLHPSAMVLSADKSRLYVANSNSDTVSVIDTKAESVERTISVKPAPDLPAGSTPTALALSRDGKRLFVTLAALNAVAVVDPKKATVLGMIPTAWYPASVQTSADDSRLYVASIKGMGARAPDLNVPVPGQADRAGRSGYNSHDDAGTISLIPMPSESVLADYTATVARNTSLPEMRAALMPKPARQRVTAVPLAPGETSPIKHVVYIVKENRNYDGVFGDLPQGNGDPKLCLYGRQVSPNHHALAEQFVLLDNLYVNGALSAEGHMWANQGITSDYIERASGSWSRGYPFDGTDAMAFASTGFIWDGVLRKGLSFRNYGEFAISPTETFLGITGKYRMDLLKDPQKPAPEIKARVSVHTLEPYTNPDFAPFDMSVPDAQRAEVFLRDFREFERRGEMPAFTLMLLPNDHSAGMTPDYPTPRAMIADNDVALGRIVEAISKSRFWKETAIFVIEDDSQDGLDHVDGRRTVGFVISPYVKRKSVDSTFYNNNSMLRTMELMLGLPPMTPFDLIANPMSAAFQDSPDLTPYTALPNQWPLDELNKPVAELKGKAREYARLSLKPEFRMMDEGDEELKNRIEWFSVKGPRVPYPGKRDRD
jgi:YVTN family beta-propeller protein